MKELLDDLEPKMLWRYFLELSKIPRPTGKEQEAAEWVMDIGRKLGLEVKQDAVGNVLILKPATPGKENNPVVCLQSHLDMVWEKDKDSDHDFTKDLLDIYRDGDIITARGTTLGGDNGIGVALGLSLLSSDDISHGPLEVLFTVQNESPLGTIGADNIQPGFLKAEYYINLDAEIEGILIIGFAGDLDTIAERKVTMTSPRAGSTPYCLKVTGLRGGYSGLEINDGLGNAIRLLAQLLYSLRKKFQFELSSIKGGNRHNAIPHTASAIIFLDPADVAAIKKELDEHEAHWREAFGKFDPNITFSLEKSEGDKVMSRQDFNSVVGMLLCGPHGMIAMSPVMDGLVQTSTNLGLVDTENEKVKLTYMTRSALDKSKDALGERIEALLSLCGFEWKHIGGYPGWQPRPDSRLVKLTEETYYEIFKRPIRVTAVHAGMECCTIANKFPGIEMVSLGPDVNDFHTTSETVTVSTTMRFWQLVRGLLERI